MVPSRLQSTAAKMIARAQRKYFLLMLRNIANIKKYNGLYYMDFLKYKKLLCQNITKKFLKKMAYFQRRYSS